MNTLLCIRYSVSVFIKSVLFYKCGHHIGFWKAGSFSYNYFSCKIYFTTPILENMCVMRSMVYRLRRCEITVNAVRARSSKHGTNSMQGVLNMRLHRIHVTHVLHQNDGYIQTQVMFAIFWLRVLTEEQKIFIVLPSKWLEYIQLYKVSTFPLIFNSFPNFHIAKKTAIHLKYFIT